MNSQSQNLHHGVLLALASALLMSLTAALIRHTATLTSIEVIVAVQYVVSLIMLLPWLARQGIQGLHTQRPGLHLARGLSGWACFYTYYLAIDQIPLIDAAPLCVPRWLLRWLGIRLSWLRWLPLLIGFAGITLILQHEGQSLSFWHLTAQFLQRPGHCCY